MGVCVFVAGTALGDPIEVVPTSGATISTNINQRVPAEKRDFETMVPDGAQRFNPPDDSWQANRSKLMPPSAARTLTPREKELLDRRKNWVFMTPEELISGEKPEETLGIKQYDKDGNEKESMTAMERYYQRLIEPNRKTATNHVDRNADSWSTATNTTAGEEQNVDDASPFESPFKSSLARQAFQPVRPNSFSDVFGNGPDSTTPDAESIREAQVQSNHMDSFRQLWDIDQPSAAAAASVSSSGSSGFTSSSFPSMQPVLGTISRSMGVAPAQSASAPAQPAPTPHVTPPRPTFTRQSPTF